jgi:hypothetical protein
MVKFYVGEFYRIDGGMGEDGVKRDVFLFHVLDNVIEAEGHMVDAVDNWLRVADKEFARNDGDHMIGIMTDVVPSALSNLL